MTVLRTMIRGPVNGQSLRFDDSSVSTLVFRDDLFHRYAVHPTGEMRHQGAYPTSAGGIRGDVFHRGDSHAGRP